MKYGRRRSSRSTKWTAQPKDSGKLGRPGQALQSWQLCVAEVGLRRRRYGIDGAVNDFATGFTWGVIAFLVLLGLAILFLVGLWLW